MKHLDRHGLWPRAAPSLRGAQQHGNPANPTPGAAATVIARSAATRQSSQSNKPAQPPLSLRATRSNPAPLSNNAFSQIPFLIHWIAAAFGLAMTKPRHYEEAKPTWQSSQSNTRRGMCVQFGAEFAANSGYNLQASAFLRHIYAELREPPTPIHVTNAK